MAASVPLGISGSRKHHTALYFLDGDLILEATSSLSENATSSFVLFRIHRWLLAHHSPIFRDMLSLPYPRSAGTDEIYDGVSVVKLTDDARDVESLLQILYFPA